MKIPNLAGIATTALVLIVVGATPGRGDQLTITPLEAGFAPVVAQFNPSEISVAKSVPWRHRKKGEGDTPVLEFTAAEPRTMSIELLFDTYETGQDVSKLYVDGLVKLANVDPALQRPPMVMVSWGSLPTFTGVISGVDVRWWLFLPDATPVRATVTLHVREASGATGHHAVETAAVPCTADTDCSAGRHCLIDECVATQP